MWRKIHSPTLAVFALSSRGGRLRERRNGQAQRPCTPPLLGSSTRLIALGVVMLPIGVLVVRRKGPVRMRLFGVGLLTLLPILCWSSAWAASSQYAVVADDRIEFKSGAPGAVSGAARFSDCQRFEFQTRQVAGDRGKPEEAVIPVAMLKDGRKIELDVPHPPGRSVGRFGRATEKGRRAGHGRPTRALDRHSCPPLTIRIFFSNNPFRRPDCPCETAPLSLK